MRLPILFLLIVFFGLPISAQKIMVYNILDNQPIPNATIYNEAKSISTITDFDGVADISDFSNHEVLYFSHLLHKEKRMVKSELVKLGTMYLEPNENQLSEVVISVSKWEQDQKDVTQKIVSVSPEDIALATPQTSADLLQSSGQVFVQKSQLGGGSPIIRGFSTNRLLLTVDGVRMNTAIFRAGNVQNVISIDPFAVHRTEVILGPGSVVYGSDAVGGVLNFYTKQPKFAISGKNKISGNAIARYASASNEKTAHIDVNIGFDKWAFLTSLSYTDFGDLKMGKYGPDDYLRNEYAKTINGTDTIMQNEDPRKQVYTGYSQVNALQKVRYMPNEKWTIGAGLMYTETSDYPRYDRLIRKKKGKLRSAAWYYGPQRWFMGNIEVLQKSKGVWYDKMKITAAYQYFQESRNDRDFGSTTLSRTKEQVDAYSLNWDFDKEYKNTSLYYGLEYVLNQVYSNGSEDDIKTGVTQDAPSRYPDGSTWQSIAAYASVKHKINEELRFQGGLRYNRIILYSTFDDTFYDFPFDEANLDTDALTGTAGLSWLPNRVLQWKLNFSTAFRAPNIDDIGKLFDPEPNTIVVPNPNLRPEHAYNAELGVVLKPSDRFTIDLSTYYTHLDHALVRRPFLFNGSSTLTVVKGEDTEVVEVQAIQNAAKAKAYGFEAGLEYSFCKNMKLTSQYTFVRGEEELDNQQTVPSRHVSPQFGNTHLIYQNQKWTLDLSAIYNGEIRYENLAPSEKNKAYLYAKDHNKNPYAPSWYTLNLRSRYQITKSLGATLSVENITDQRYRSYSSGIAAPGRNFIFSIKYTL